MTDIFETGLRKMNFIVQELDKDGWHTVAAFGTDTDARIFLEALKTPQWSWQGGDDKRIIRIGEG